MEGRRRALWLALIVSAAAAVAFNCDAATAYDGGQPAAGSSGPDTNVLCVSKCGTCPTVCSSSPPPPPSDGSSAPPGTPSGGGWHSTSPPGQNKGGHPSSYYYFFTAGSGRRAGPSGYALVSFMVLVSLAANFQ